MVCVVARCCRVRNWKMLACSSWGSRVHTMTVLGLTCAYNGGADRDWVAIYEESAKLLYQARLASSHLASHQHADLAW
eukprot:2445474-Rhodomonas_salina.5